MPRRSFVDFTSAAAGISFKLAVVAAFLVVPCTRAAYGGTARPNPPVLSALSTQFPKDNQLEARVLTATLPPHSTSVWHQHSAPVVVYVIQGTFTLEFDGRKAVSKNAGEALLEPKNAKVRAANRGKLSTKVVIFQLSRPGVPFLTPTGR